MIKLGARSLSIQKKNKVTELVNIRREYLYRYFLFFILIRFRRTTSKLFFCQILSDDVVVYTGVKFSPHMILRGSYDWSYDWSCNLGGRSCKNFPYKKFLEARNFEI